MKVVVQYQHNSSDFRPIYLGLDNPQIDGMTWIPAFRDTIGGRRVVWVYAEDTPREVWLKDASGSRKVKSEVR